MNRITDKHTISVGPITVIPKGTHNPTSEYKYLNVVYTDSGTYICSNRNGAPTNADIEDEHYWQPVAKHGLDGAVSFATQKDWENESAAAAATPALVKPRIDEVAAVIEALRKYGTVNNADHLQGKTVSELFQNINAVTLEGNTLTQILGSTVEGSKTANGWVKLANGLIIQWGTAVKGTATFPVAFPNAAFGVVSAGATTVSVTKTNASLAITSGIAYYSGEYPYYYLTTSAYGGFWLAIGY